MGLRQAMFKLVETASPRPPHLMLVSMTVWPAPHLGSIRGWFLGGVADHNTTRQKG